MENSGKLAPWERNLLYSSDMKAFCGFHTRFSFEETFYLPIVGIIVWYMMAIVLVLFCSLILRIYTYIAVRIFT